jgi:hypothetical protein
MENLIEQASGRAWLGGKRFSKGFATIDYLRNGGLGDIDFGGLGSRHHHVEQKEGKLLCN